MDWNEILQLYAWVPLSHLKSRDFEPVADNIYKIGVNAYVRAQERNKALELDDPRAPFVTMAYWSPSIDGLKRLAFGDPSFTLEEPLPAPPPEISFGTSGLYSELLSKASTDRSRIVERAEYSNKGIFLKKSIIIDRFDYSFISNEEKDERTFLIKISLLKQDC